jgi:PleD family two-component response regulator
MRILVVDDSEDERDLADAILRAAGYEHVNAVNSAAEAFQFLAIGESAKREPSPVDLVLLDILMPGMDGIEACARIRGDERYADVPVIMVTRLSDLDSLANAFVAGATDYITKPVNRVELVARARSALKLKAELDRRRARERELLHFMSSWGDRRASNWIDKSTGLFVGEVAEAYLISNTHFPAATDTSVIALAIDRLDAVRSVHGDAAAAKLTAQVARAVQATMANVGVIAASYRDGAIVLILPELSSEQALELGEALRTSIARLGLTNSEAIAANHVTVSVAVASGRVNRSVDGAHLLTRALSAAPRVSAAGGNRVVPEHA